MHQCSAIDVLKFSRIFEQETLHFNFALGLENYVAVSGQGELNQRLISRNTSWQEEQGKSEVVALPGYQGRGQDQSLHDFRT